MTRRHRQNNSERLTTHQRNITLITNQSTGTVFFYKPLFCKAVSGSWRFTAANLLQVHNRRLVSVEPRQPQRSSGMAGFGSDVMRSWLRSSSASDCTSTSQPPVTERQRARKRRRAFGLAKMKFLRQPVATSSNLTTSSTTFMSHCQEIKHICSNCRGTEPRDGERTAARVPHRSTRLGP